MARMLSCMAEMIRRRPDIAVEPLLSNDARTDVRVLTTGHLPFKENWVHHRFSGFTVGFVVRGAGQYRMSKGPEHAILPGTLFCVHRGPVFHYGSQHGSTWEEYYLVVHGTGLRRWLKQGWLWTDGTVRQVQDSAAMAARFQELRLLLARGGPGDRDRAVSVAERVLLEGYFGQRGIPDAFTFSRTFKRCTGVAPQHYRDSLALTGSAKNA